jgi:hypothetical protein
MARNGNKLVLGSHSDGRPIILQPDHRLQHTSIVGQTGSGKSRYVEYLLRQDVRAWPKTRCGMLVVDPHGEMVDGIMAWIAANKLRHLPIVPIDLRRTDRVVSYNVLRRRAAVPSVIIDNFVRAMAYVWGKPGTDETPLFERWAGNALHLLYDQHKTLADAVHLFSPDGRVALDRIESPLVRRDWAVARRNWKDFERDTQSAVNRFRRFLLNPTMRAVFGQTSTSLDLGRALDDGQIVLVSLGRKRGNVSQENSDLFATLLLSDLWMAVEERGKSEHNNAFYLYLDEFQRFVTPAMAESLAEARGFGIGMTLITQFPRQILNAGPYGPRIYDEIRENCRTKIAFRQRSKENLEIVANELFLGTFNPLRVKHQHYSTKVLGHDLRYLPSYGHSSTATTGGGKEHSRTVGSNHSVANTWNHTDTVGHSLTRSSTDSIGVSASESEAWSDSTGATESSVRSGNRSTGRSQSGGTSTNKSTGESVGLSGKHLLTGGGTTLRAHAADGATNQSWNLGRADGHSANESAGTFETDSSGWNEAASRNASTTEGGGSSIDLSESHSESVAEADSESHADSRGGSETRGTNEADTTGESTKWSNALGRSETMAPMLIPRMGKEADAPVFWSLNEQLFLAMKRLFLLQDREAYVLAGDMTVPVPIKTPDVNRPDICHVVVDLTIGWYQQESGLTLPFEQAVECIRKRDQERNAGEALAAADEDFAPAGVKTAVVTVRRVERK